jgi:plastocyanin
LRKLCLLIAMLASLAVAAVATAAGSTSTTLRDDYFTKPKLTISAGTTVVWKWKSTEEPHTVTDVKKRFGSKRKVSGVYKHKFAKAGKYTVFCKVHPQVMRQRIVVK